MTLPVRAQPSLTQMRRGRLPACSCRHPLVDGPERPSGRNASPSGINRSGRRRAHPDAPHTTGRAGPHPAVRLASQKRR
jgi:hypothetical protein